jgi:lipocalin
MKRLTLAMTCAFLALSACGYPYVRVYDDVDDPFHLQRMSADSIGGQWFVTAYMPTRQDDGCSHMTANLATVDEGHVSIAFQCVKNGQTVRFPGIADLAGYQTSRYDGLIQYGDYWVIDRSPDGRTLLIGNPARASAYMLHRDRRATPAEYDWANEVLGKNAFDIAALQRVSHW